MMKRFCVSLFFATCLSAPSPADAQSGPSFDCTKASHDAEKIICADATLSLLDRQMDASYQKALEAAGKLDAGRDKAVKSLHAWQRGGMKGRNDCWKEADKQACIATSYRRDIAILEAKWALVTAGEPTRYRCSDQSEVLATPFNTSTDKAIRVEYGDTSDVFTQPANASSQRYDGSFGAYLQFHNNQIHFVWDQSKPELICTKL